MKFHYFAAAMVFFAVGCKSKEEPAKRAEPVPAAATEKKALEPLDVPLDRVFAASNALRIVDVAAGQVVAGVDFKRAVTSIEFSGDGRRAFLGCSDGVREVDSSASKDAPAKVLGMLSSFPVRQLLRSPDGQHLVVLEHEVKTGEGGPMPGPFRARIIELSTGKTLRVDEIGERILAVIPSFAPNRHHLVVEESGLVRLGRPGTPLSSGEKLDLVAGIPSKGLMVRPYVALSHDGRLAYVPVEGKPSRVLELDLERGTHRALNLGAQVLLRGLAATSDGTKLVVDASNMVFVVDLQTGDHTRLDLGDAHTGASISPDGRRVYLAQTVHETGGAITIVQLDPLRVQGKIHLDDISPWAIAVQPRPAMASLR